MVPKELHLPVFTPLCRSPHMGPGLGLGLLKIMELGGSDLCMSSGSKPSRCLVASFLTLLEPWSYIGCLAMLLEKPRVQTTGSCHEEGRDPEAIWRGRETQLSQHPGQIFNHSSPGFHLTETAWRTLRVTRRHAELNGPPTAPFWKMIKWFY